MENKRPNPLTVLVIVAHADDIEFGCAGSIARWIQEGAEVTYCIVTDNGSGSNDPTVSRTDLIKTRREEQLAAAQQLGVKEVRFLDYPDGILQPTLELRRDLTRVIREIKPYRVIAQDPSTYFVEDYYINHPDHRAAGEAAVYAVFPSAETRPIFPELLTEGLEPHHVTELYLTLTLKPNCTEDITATMDLKIAALKHHKSQISGEDFEWVKEWAREAGKEAGVEYAERYRVMRFERE